MMTKNRVTSDKCLVTGIGARAANLLTHHASRIICRAFSMVELLVTMTLLSLIVLVLMVVFNSTQQAFRAGVTQTDVLEGSRAAVDLIATDLRAMVPSGGSSNYVYNNVYYSGAVNFCSIDNNYDVGYFSVPAISYLPLQQGLPGTLLQRTNVLNWVFILGRENTKWTAAGYVVNPNSASPLYPLYRFYKEAGISTPPRDLYNLFWTNVYYAQWTNLSHVMDGVVHFAVHPYDPAGYLMTNNVYVVIPGPPAQIRLHKNVHFYPPYWGEVGTCFYSNAVPAAVEFQLGVLEDRALQRAESFGSLSAASNYLSQQSAHVHLFRQRVAIPNVDSSAYP